MDGDKTNPWIRANLEQFNPETLRLIPPAYQEDYSRLMKERLHRKAIADLALDRVSENDRQCRLFFAWMVEVTGYATPPDNVVNMEDYRHG